MQTAKVDPPTMPEILQTKSELRALMRARRKAFVAARGGNSFSSEILSDNSLISLLKNKNSVALYCATPHECDVIPSFFARFSPEHKFALPCVNAKVEDMVFREWDLGGALIKSPLGFEQPDAQAPLVIPDMIVAPLIAFDRSGNRLGQGGGHYDRAFAAHPHAIRIGVAWSCQEVAQIANDPWDMPLDAILTERDLIFTLVSRI